MISFEKLERNTCKIIAFCFVTENNYWKNRFSYNNFNSYIIDKSVFQFLMDFSNLPLIYIKKRKEKSITCWIVKIK